MKNVYVPSFDDLYQNSKNINAAINMASEMKENLEQLLLNIVEYRMVPFLLKYPDIESVFLDVKYEYDDQGRCPENIMAWFNDNWDMGNMLEECWREEVDGLFADIAGLLLEDIKINSAELLAKYHAIKLDNDLISKPPSKKIKNKL
jgi:hypothetical protein